MDPRGHLQATGVDVARRKQYLYHEHWRAHRDRMKFDTMVEFALSLPRLRSSAARDLGLRGAGTRLGPEEVTRERVLACAIRLLDVGFFRIGSEDYAENNSSYGLTTMLREHVAVSGDELVFDFPAKSGRRRVQEIADRDVLAVVEVLKRRRSGRAAARLPRRARLVRAHRRRGERLHRPARERALHREGLSHLERHSIGGRRARSAGTPRRARREPVQARPQGRSGDQDRRRIPRQHAGGVPCLLRRPARDRPLPRGHDHRSHRRAGSPAGATTRPSSLCRACAGASRRPSWTCFTTAERHEEPGRRCL
jgi:hypothetical protein